jgi:hypothetical protein
VIVRAPRLFVDCDSEDVDVVVHHLGGLSGARARTEQHQHGRDDQAAAHEDETGVE